MKAESPLNFIIDSEGFFDSDISAFKLSRLHKVVSTRIL
jgi:hypothetical protein